MTRAPIAPALAGTTFENVKESETMTRTSNTRAAALACALLLIAAAQAFSQSGSTRPRRVNRSSTPATTRTDANKTTTTRSDNEPLLDVQPVTGTPNASTGARTTTTNDNATTTSSSAPAANRSNNSNAAAGASDTTHAYTLLQQKQYAAAAAEAKSIAAKNPNDSEAWKIAGFAEFNLKQYQEAADDLQHALDLQRAAKQEDANTLDGLARSLILTEKFDRALPLLVIATTRQGAPVDASMLYYRGIAEYRTGKGAEAERSFNAAIKANPKDAASLYYLGQIAFARNDLDGTIAALNRATLADSRLASAWSLLTSTYLRRAASATVPAKADADYLSAVRAGESLTKIRTDAEAATLFGQALIGANQFPRAAIVLERAAAGADAKGVTLYLLGVANSRAKNFPKAINALERAAAKTPDDVNVYRELGYAYEVSKLYAKALATYEKGAQLAPADTDFKESADRVRPFAK
jgi:tetratricopeptide (TPR) repeat protein